jgi:hypothetical protein
MEMPTKRPRPIRYGGGRRPENLCSGGPVRQARREPGAQKRERFLLDLRRDLPRLGSVASGHRGQERRDRWAEGHVDRVIALAAEMVRNRYAVIAVMGRFQIGPDPGLFSALWSSS